MTTDGRPLTTGRSSKSKMPGMLNIPGILLLVIPMLNVLKI
ncbi:hypothetical protein J2Y45_002415 [Dyadobacter sp. BE34]|uniref:Uncharacterized protein n=1 Tax=Dyadobacter fermentans TaxID=94254 RepID=A0ABU1QVV9_9BACT|nr:hypothetical protein [Dyadobacter fermentans]MDR7042964.1 hypothetical protein [Dyadobacter sp. BE242]MDR7197276.1 hypothetical protein [Dyadobacter sp. BE34]MDR7215289.1 hypothetical protein [Dyadobacter sp. BE31]MDR7262825.1 hypothetical protein [Dyadobacter sp. BE32]